MERPMEPPRDFPVQLLEYGRTRKYQAGDVIATPAETKKLVRFILTGEARVVILDNESQEVNVDHLHAGEMFEASNFLSEIPSHAHASLKAHEACEVLEVPSEAFETILANNPDIGLILNRNLGRKLTRLRDAIFQSRLKKRALRSLISRKEHIFPDYVIGDHVRRRLAARMEDLAQTDAPVLVVGEPGVGKEYVAHRIFGISPVRKELFLSLDLFRQPQEFFTDGKDAQELPDGVNPVDEQTRLLFGAAEQATNGTVNETPGYVDLSEHGTLMIRGVERLAPIVQQALLKCSSTGTFTRLGGTAPRKAEFRLIATTRLDPSKAPEQIHPLIHGLAHRSIGIPPLRHRRKEIPALIEHYVERFSREVDRQKPKLPRDTLALLINYSWPGNDMELSTTLKRAVLVSVGEVLRPRDIYFDLKKVEGRGKLNLLRLDVVRKVFLSPLFPAILQSAVTPFFLILLALLFLGPSDPMRNPAALFCWSVGWPTLIIGAFLFARFWCTLCPIGTLSRLAQRIVSLNLPFPAILKRRSDYVIAGSVLCVIWFETATDIRNSPTNLALLLLTMLVSAIAVAVLFERQSWCQYLCGLGGMVGVAAKASMLELRADQNVCISRCTSNECYVGTESREGCPFGQSVPRLDSNRLCKICGMCVKNCPHDAVNLSLRIPGKEIWEMRRANTGTAFLVIGMLSGLLSELLTKTPFYATVTATLPLPVVARFTVVFAALLLTGNLLMIGASWISHKIYGDSWEDNYCRHGLGLIPLALTAFVAYHLYYLINLGVHLPLLVGQFLDSDLCRQLAVEVPPSATHFVQRVLIWMGLAWTVLIIYRLGRASHAGFIQALLGAVPHVLAAVFIALLTLEGIRFSFY